MLSASVPRNSVPSAATTPIAARSAGGSRSRCPDRRGGSQPPCGSYSRSSRSIAVVLPAPERPTMAVTRPAGAVKVRPRSTGCCRRRSRIARPRSALRRGLAAAARRAARVLPGRHQAQRAAQRRQVFLQRHRARGQRLDRAEQLLQVRDEHHHVAGRELPAQHQQAAEAEHQRLARVVHRGLPEEERLARRLRVRYWP